MNKSKILLLASLILFVNIKDVNAATMESITKALQKYCVPKQNDYFNSSPICNSIFEGKYEPKKDCGCYNSTYLVYDAKLRRCKPKCPGGYYVKHHKTGKCDGGQYKLKIQKEEN